MRKSILFLFFSILLTVGALTSCDSFLNSEKIKNEIEASIAYANASAYTIHVDSPESSGVVKSPAGGIASKKVTDKFTISFDSATELFFYKWTVIDYITGKDLTNKNYFSFEDIYNSQTECTLLKAPEENVNLCLQPVLVARPRILAKTPVPGTENYRNNPIQISFDHDMDPDSIYYTGADITKLEADWRSDKNKQHQFITVTVNGETKKVGYVEAPKNSNNWTVYYKNIKISNINGGGNLLDYFDPPTFETPRLLCISTFSNAHIPDWTQVLVEIDKNMFYKYSEKNGKEKNISLAMGEVWNYQVSNTDDPVFPLLLTNTIQISNSSTATDLPIITKAEIKSSPSSNSIMTNTERSVKVNFKLRDQESGPSQSFKLKLTQFATCNVSNNSLSYTTLAKELVHEKDVDFDSVSYQIADFDGEIDLTDFDLSDGVYGLSFEFTDRTGHTIYYPATSNSYLPFRILTTSDLPFPKNFNFVGTDGDSVTVAWLLTSDNSFDGYDVKWTGLRINGEKFSGKKSLSNDSFSYKIENTHNVRSLLVSIRTKNGSEQQAYKTFDAFKTAEFSFLVRITDNYTDTESSSVECLKGILRKDDDVDILGYGKSYSSKIKKLETFGITSIVPPSEIQTLSAGSKCMVYYTDNNLINSLYSSSNNGKGLIICKPGELVNHKKYKAYLYLYSSEEGGVTGPVSSGSQFLFLSDEGISGRGTYMTFNGSFDPGTSKIVDLEFKINDDNSYEGEPLYEGQHFQFQDGNRFIGHGVILSLESDN